MKNVAYKTTKDAPGLPDGFVTEHFETDEDVEEGYSIVSKDNFAILLANNISLLQNYESSTKGIIAASAAPPAPDTTRVAQPVSEETKAARQKVLDEQAKNAELFAQFLAWKASQSST